MWVGLAFIKIRCRKVVSNENHPTVCQGGFNLGVARNILLDRLGKLVDAGVLQTRPASDSSAYLEYVLTRQGEDLFAVIVALRQWDERHLFEADASGYRGRNARVRKVPEAQPRF